MGETNASGEGDDLGEIRDLLDAEDESAPAEANDAEESFDDRVEWFGWRAGAVLTAILVGMLLVGPWRLFDVTFSGGGIPFELRDSAEVSITLVAPVVFVVVGAVTSLAYRLTTDDVVEDYKGDLATMVVVTQILAALALFVLVMLVPIGQLLLGGDVAAAGILVVGSLVYLAFFTFFEIIGITIYVGIPTYIGTFLGGLVGSVLD